MKITDFLLILLQTDCRCSLEPPHSVGFIIYILYIGLVINVSEAAKSFLSR